MLTATAPAYKAHFGTGHSGFDIIIAPGLGDVEKQLHSMSCRSLYLNKNK